MDDEDEDALPVPVSNDKHWLFKDGTGTDDNIAVDLWSNGSLHITVDNPWAGCSETGFGESGAITLRPDVARALAEWLMARFAPPPSPAAADER